MRSVGEVMAIGRCFEEALQKAVRMLDIGKIGIVCNQDDYESESEEHLRHEIAFPTDERLYKLVKSIKIGIPIMEIYRLSGVDPFFLNKIKNIVDMETQLCKIKLSDDNATDIIHEAKRLGFSDEQIAFCQKQMK